MTTDADLPSDGELEILAVLWDRGPSTVREIHRRLRRSREVGYNTIGKLLQIMVGKGTVRRDESRRAHVYTAAIERAEIEGRLVGDLAERAFGGSAARLALRALAERPADEAEVNELRALLDECLSIRGTDAVNQ